MPGVLPSPGNSRETEQERWFRETIQPHEPNLRAYLRRKFPGVTDVDDVVQETYARLFRARQSGKKLHPGYVFTIARNAALDLLRRHRVVKFDSLATLEPRVVIEEKPTPLDTVARAQEIEILHEAIAALPERCRLIMMLQRMQDLSNREIAHRLGISIHTVNAQVVIGLARCRDYLRDRGVLKLDRR